MKPRTRPRTSRLVDGLGSVLRRIFPAPRRALSIWDAAPFVSFLVAFAGVIAFLVLTGRLTFARPAMFGLMAVTPWLWWMSLAGYAGLSRGRAAVALWVRLLLAGILVMVLAEPRSVRTLDVLSVVFCVDLSDSVGAVSKDEAASNKALEFVAKMVSEKTRGGDRSGLVTFARNSAVEQQPEQQFPLEGGRVITNSQIDRDATNIEQALALAGAVIPPDTAGRIVLLSDATATEGNLDQVLGELKSRDIAVDVLPISYEYDREVWLERLDLPRNVKLGEPYKATVVLNSLKAGQGQLSLRENGKEIHTQDLKFPAGKSRHDFEINLRAAGYYEYSATLTVADGEDRISQNNTVMNYIMVSGEGKVLLVKNPVGDERDWVDLVKAIQGGERATEVVDAIDLPRDALSLMPYDAIVFVNVGVDAFDPLQMQAVHDAVKDLGIGFLMVGGDNSFGPGGYHRTVIEAALPVSMDITQKKVLPKGALAIILHTCEFPEGNTWAKRITKQAIKVLGAQDEVGLLAYTNKGEDWIFPLTPAGEYDKLVPQINAAEVGDMPSFQNTMQLAHAGLKKSDAATKHLIVISDGDPSPPTPALVQQFIADKISISGVAVFPHQAQDIQVMRGVCDATGGRFYFPSRADELPAIFIKESKTLKRGMIQTKTVMPEAGLTSRNILTGIDQMPSLDGYVLTTLKERLTENILHVTEEEQIDPILATWSYGLGRSAAFTSDLSSNWGKRWVTWNKYQAFVKQLLTDISRVQKKGNLRMWTQASGTQTEIFVEDFAPADSAESLDLRAVVAGPRDKSETVTLRQVGPRRYQATVPLWGRGRYQVLAKSVGGDRQEIAQDGFIVSYSPEYLRFRSNPQIYRDIIAKTGGQELSASTTVEDIYETHRKAKSNSSPIFDWFLIALAFLVPLDVGVRRVQIDLFAIRSLLGLDRKKQTTATMGALLQRKQAVGSALDAQRAASRDKPPPGATGGSAPQPTAPRPGSPRPPAPPAAEPAPPEGGSATTSRLLANKRKRQQEGP